MTPLDSIALVGRILNMREAGYGVEAMIDVVEEFERAVEERERERIAAWVEANVMPAKKARALAAMIRKGEM